jgi:hypothetical protein
MSFGLSNSNGTASTVARSDHAHGTPSLGTAAAQALAASASAGSAVVASHEDHVHPTTGLVPENASILVANNFLFYSAYSTTNAHVENIPLAITQTWTVPAGYMTIFSLHLHNNGGHPPISAYVFGHLKAAPLDCRIAGFLALWLPILPPSRLPTHSSTRLGQCG